MEKKFGKITRVTFGEGGYQDAQFGISFDLGSESMGCGDFWGFWASKPGTGAQWTEHDQILAYGKVMARIRDLLRESKRSDVSKLVGTPVEMTFDDNRLKSWRVFTEVL